MAAKAPPKPRAARLKVFRTAIGFHDAYVAAPSRKAALAAWGTTKDLFARGVAEEVVDPDLTAEALHRPGAVIRRLRSVPADPAGADRPKRRRPKAELAASAPAPVAAPPPPPPPPPPPRPDNGELERARRALAAAREQYERDRRELAARERELAEARRALDQRQGKELRLLTRKLEQAEQDYTARLARWRTATARKDERR